MSDSSTTRRDIARHQARYLRSNPDVCADMAVPNHPYLRFHDGQWQWVSMDARNRVDGEALDFETVVDRLAQRMVTLKPTEDAHLGSGTTIWERVEAQDVFTGHDRCFWCGHSERTHDLGEYETTEDGICILCDGCEDDWNRDDQIVGEIRRRAEA